MDFHQARISLDDRGCPFSPEFGDIYASRDGAYEQSRFVFLKGNGLPERWRGRDTFVILENGFGLGTNFLSTLKAWREDPQRSDRLFYLAIEAFPADAEALLKYASPHLLQEASELSQKWPQMTPGLHRLTFDHGRVNLDLYFMPSAQAAKKLSGPFDALYLDGFSPKKNPQMWEPRLLKALCASANTDATLATWCVAGSVRQALSEAGFEIKKIQGFGHKAQMTVGRFAPRYKHRRSGRVQSALAAPKSALVIGAGLAGAAVTQKLSERGIQVIVVDAGPVAACGASALRWGVFHAQPSGDDNFLFRISRAGLELLLKRQPSFPDLLRNHGLFQMARDAEELAKWKDWSEAQKPFAFPAQFLSLVTEHEAESLVGIGPQRGGFWHGEAGIAAVGQWVRERLENSRAELIFNTRVSSLTCEEGIWTARLQDGSPVASADAAVVCCAAESSDLLGLSLPLTRWKGRLSLICDDSLSKLQGAVTGPGYAIHSPDGWSGVGATYERSGQSASAEEAHKKNLSHIKALFPQLSSPLARGFYSGYRCVAPDRLPIIGRVGKPNGKEEHLYLSCAMGSRGTVFCELGAHIISAQMFGEPEPLELDLLKAISPGRFLPEKPSC